MAFRFLIAFPYLRLEMSSSRFKELLVSFIVSLIASFSGDFCLERSLASPVSTGCKMLDPVGACQASGAFNFWLFMDSLRWFLPLNCD